MIRKYFWRTGTVTLSWRHTSNLVVLWCIKYACALPKISPSSNESICTEIIAMGRTIKIDSIVFVFKEERRIQLAPLSSNPSSTTWTRISHRSFTSSRRNEGFFPVVNTFFSFTITLLTDPIEWYHSYRSISFAANSSVRLIRRSFFNNYLLIMTGSF